MNEIFLDISVKILSMNGIFHISVKELSIFSTFLLKYYL